MIDSIIFDVGNVLAGFDWVSYLNRQPFDEKTKKILASAVFSHPDWVELDRGILSNEEIIRRFIRNAVVLKKKSVPWPLLWEKQSPCAATQWTGSKI